MNQPVYTEVMAAGGMFAMPCKEGYTFAYVIRNSVGKYLRKERTVPAKTADGWRPYWQQWRFEDEVIDAVLSTIYPEASLIAYLPWLIDEETYNKRTAQMVKNVLYAYFESKKQSQKPTEEAENV